MFLFNADANFSIKVSVSFLKKDFFCSSVWETANCLVEFIFSDYQSGLHIYSLKADYFVFGLIVAAGFICSFYSCRNLNLNPNDTSFQERPYFWADWWVFTLEVSFNSFFLLRNWTWATKNQTLSDVWEILKGF